MNNEIKDVLGVVLYDKSTGKKIASTSISAVSTSINMVKSEVIKEESVDEKDVISVKDTILKYLDEVYPHYNWSWHDVLRHTNGEAIFIIPLYKQAESYFKNKQVKE